MEASIEEVHEQLSQAIYELEALCCLDRELQLDGPAIEAALVLGRRIAPTTIPPLFVRFNTEVGPLEPMPSRFRVPFPTMEDFKFSVLNFPASAVPKPVVAVNLAPQPKPVEDEYADDF
jgi:hypothetical protein